MGFWSDFGGSLIDAGAGFVSGLFGLKNTSDTNEANLRAVQETNKANMELAKYNWQQQIDMWNRQNEYNSPISQMTRLKDAGLNPNLVYGNGVTGNTSGSAPTPSTPTMQAPHFEKSDFGFIGQSSQAAVQAYYQRKLLDSDLSLKKSQERAIESQNLERNQKIAESMMRTARGWFDYNLANELKDNTMEAAALSIFNMKQKMEMDSYKLHELMPLEKQKAQTTNKLLAAQEHLTVRQADEITARIWKISEEIVNFGVQRGLWHSQTRLNNAYADKADSEAAFNDSTFNSRVASVAQDLTNAVVTGNFKRLEYNWKSSYGFSNDQFSQVMNTLDDQLRKQLLKFGFKIF